MSGNISINQVWLACPALAVLTGLLTPGPAPARDDVHWRPAETRVFIASLCWYKGDKQQSFPVDERLDGKMADFFLEKGVPREQVKLILDQKATVKHVQREFARFMKDSKPGELLIAYISGHGCPGQFCLYDGELDWVWFFDTIEKDFKGKRVLLTSDCCFSGGPVELAKKRKTNISYACLSSTAHQVAGSGWRFAQCLLRGFASNTVMDLNGDGHVDLEELAEYAKHYMTFCAEGMPLFTTTGEFSSKLQLARTVGKKRDNVGDLVEAKFGDKWCKAEIIGVRPKGFRVHFVEDTKTENDRNVTKDKVRPFEYPRYKVGDSIVVRSGDGLKRAKVVETFDALFRCRLNGEEQADRYWYGPGWVRKK
jgi:hypothetical protein